MGVGGDVGEGGTSVPVDSGESKGDWNGSSGVVEAVAVELAVGEAVGVLLDNAGAVLPPGDGKDVASSTEAPQAESKAPSAAAPAPLKNRRRLTEPLDFDIHVL